MKKIALWFLLVILLSGSVAALAVSPGRTTIDFEPKEHRTVEFDVINDQSKDIKVLLSVEGDATNSIVVLKEHIVELKANERKRLSYDVFLPERFETPGTKEIRVLLVQLPDEEANEPVRIGATVGVVTQLRIRVPYEGKYAQLENIEVTEANTGGIVNFIIPVNNLGTERIKLKGNLTILSPTNDVIAVVETQEESLEPKRRVLLKAQWLANVNPGKYYAVAYIDYDGNMARAEKVFTIGGGGIEIIGIETKNFQLGSIAKLDIALKNTWNEKLTVYGELFIKNSNGDDITQLKTPTIDLLPNTEDTLQAYWDTQGLSEGKYYITLRVHFGEGFVEKQFESVLTVNKLTTSLLGSTGKVALGEPSNKSILVTIIVILIIINIGWFIYMQRSKKKTKE